MGVNSLPKTVIRQRRDCDLNPGPSTCCRIYYASTSHHVVLRSKIWIWGLVPCLF